MMGEVDDGDPDAGHPDCNGLTFAPILEVDLHSVFGRDQTHTGNFTGRLAFVNRMMVGKISPTKEGVRDGTSRRKLLQS